MSETTVGCPLLLLAALIAAFTLVSGCGEDDTSGSEGSLATFPSGKSEYLRQANAMCKSERKNYSKNILSFLQREESSGGSEVDVALKAIKKVVLPINEAQLGSLHQLGAPEGDEGEVEAALDAQAEAIADLRATKQLRSINEPVKQFAGATEMLKEYGLTSCVYSP